MADLGAMKAKIVLEMIELDRVTFHMRIIDNKNDSELLVDGPLRLLPYLLWALQTGDGEVVKRMQEEYNKCETKS